MATLLHLLGCTGAGKTTILDALGTETAVGTVAVGRMFRAKYPPEYFQGQAAPKHTQDEALQMYQEGVQAEIAAGKSLVLIDGQPRDFSQVAAITSMWPTHAVRYLLVHATQEVREARLRESRSGSNLELALNRLEGDYKGLHEVTTELLLAGKKIEVVDTGSLGFDVGALAKRLQSLAQRDAHGY